jgi:fido (protein-threonine AMPylation protein)
VMALWLSSSPNNNRLDRAMTVRIKGYVASRSNATQTEPIVAIGDFEPLSPIQRSSHRHKPPTTHPYVWTSECRVQGGRIPTFLNEYGASSLLTVDQLAGMALGIQNNNAWEEPLRQVADFLALNHAMHKLHVTSPNSSTEVYMKVIGQFQQSQMDRQSTSLSTNTGREATAARAQTIIAQHKTALQHALSLADPTTTAAAPAAPAAAVTLSVAKLNVIHSFLCDGLVDDAGLIRRKNVRVGSTSFGSHETVAQTFMDGLATLNMLENQLFRNNRHGHHTDTTTTTTLALIVYAAAVLLTVVDIHPYADGNGRLARIGLNWALLAKGQLPFVIQLFSTPTQRQAYVDAIKKTRRNCDLQHFGSADPNAVQKVYETTGCLFPMVDLILDRLHKAVTECKRLLNDKTSQKLQDEELAAAKRFREKAAAGSCLICFEDQPNMATLCCGKAIHLNCMAEWLSSNTSCPQCRATLPSIPERMRRNDDDDNDYLETTTDWDFDEEDFDDTTTNDMEDETETHDDSERVPRVTFGGVAILGAEDDDADGDGTMEEDDTTNDVTDAFGFEDDDTEVDDEDAEAAAAVAQVASHIQQEQQRSELPPPCVYCRNRSARGCSNTCCGRCCIAHGQYFCERHR